MEILEQYLKNIFNKLNKGDSREEIFYGILEYFLKEYWMIKVKSQDILKKSIQILNH